MSKDKLIEARAKAFKEMKAASNTENFDKEKYEEARNKVDALDAQINTFDMENKYKNQQDEIITSSPNAIATQDYRNGFDKYIAGKELAEFKNAMTEGVAEDGGYVVPETYQTTVLEKLNTLSLTRSISDVVATTSTKNIPIEGSMPEFDWIEESGTYGETKSTFGNKQIKAHKLGGIIKVSDELLNDNMISFEAYMSNQIAKGIDKKEQVALCNGNGENKPSGYAYNLPTASTIALTSSTGVTNSEVESIYYGLPEAYRKRATWRMNTKTLQKIRALNDGNGVYFYKDEIKNGTIEGRPFVIDENLPDFAVGKQPIVFGDFSFYQIADRGTMEIQRLNEKYADVGLVGFRVTVRVDAKRMFDEAFVAGQCPSS